MTNLAERVDLNVHTGSGRLVYDPKRPGMKRRTDWWAVVDVDDGIAEYYRWWVLRMKGIWLYQPSWGAHISVVRGERPRPETAQFWRKYQGETIHFVYSHEVRQTGGQGRDGTARPEHFWFVEVEAPRLVQIRAELGLARHERFHITIGRTYPGT